MRDWVAFWDSEHSIYVNARHLDVHYRNLADDIAGHVPSRTATVLDYGCGEALHADRITAVAGRVILVDAAPKVRAGLMARFKDSPNIAVRAPHDLTALADRSIDLVVMNSIVQYLSSAQLSALLVLFRRLLRPGGLLLIGDVVPPHVSALNDAMALLKFAAMNGFLWAALVGLSRTTLSDYSRLRSTLGLTLYSQAEIEAKLAAAGFSATRARTNLSHNHARMTFLARPE